MEPSTLRRLTTFGTAFAAVFMLDQATKAWTWEVLRDDKLLQIIPGVFHFQFAFNTGAAFGVGGGHSWSRVVFMAIGTLAVALMLRIALRLDTESALPRIGLGLAAGGALGNVVDRLLRVHEVRHAMMRDLELSDLLVHAQAVADAARQHQAFVELPEHGVIDFIVVYLGDQSWPAFNVADIALTAGGTLLMLWLWRETGDDESSETDTEPDAS